jgi:hypothetical protein
LTIFTILRCHKNNLIFNCHFEAPKNFDNNGKNLFAKLNFIKLSEHESVAYNFSSSPLSVEQNKLECLYSANFLQASLIFANNARNIHIKWGKVLHLSRLLLYSQILDYPEKDTDKRSSLFCPTGSDEEEKFVQE